MATRKSSTEAAPAKEKGAKKTTAERVAKPAGKDAKPAGKDPEGKITGISTIGREIKDKKGLGGR